MLQKQIKETVDSSIDEEELPVHPHVKPVSRFDGLYPQDVEELEAYWDFIHWAVTREHAVLFSIPKPQKENDFWQIELDELGNDISAFNTVDFQRLNNSKFDKYQYKLKKTYQRVTDLALLHSCISDEKGKKNIHQRFKNLVEKEFRDRAVMLVETYKNCKVRMNKDKVIEEIGELNSRIRKCNEIWKMHAYED